jgi:hypothetical protein
MKNGNTPDVVMAINPISQKLVNVLPLFEISAEVGYDDIQHELDNTIRLLVCSLGEDTLQNFSSQIKQSCEVMYVLRDMFKKLQECEISVRK